MLWKMLTVTAAVAGAAVIGLMASIAAADTQAGTAADAQVLGFVMNDIDGVEQKLDQYRGKVVLMVNVASKCGFTPQYEALEALYRAHKDEGLVVLGFPANDFMGQEPGTALEIKTFCTETYDVTFPMFAKIHVRGSDQHPLYRKLTGQPEPVGGPVKWNFQKYLVDRDGNVVERFSPKTKPDDPALVERLEELLGTEG